MHIVDQGLDGPIDGVAVLFCERLMVNRGESVDAICTLLLLESAGCSQSVDIFITQSTLYAVGGGDEPRGKFGLPVSPVLQVL